MKGFGKSCPDQSAAITKRHWTQGLKSGHDVNTPEQMCQVATLFGGIANVLLLLGGVETVEFERECEIKDLTLYHDIEFLLDGVRVRKQSGIGTGFFIPLIKPKKTPKFKGDIYNKHQLDENLKPLKTTSIPYEVDGQKVRINLKDQKKFDDAINEDDDFVTPECAIYFCPNDLCDKKYKTSAGFENHRDSKSKCRIRLRKKSQLKEVQSRVIAKFGLSPENQPDSTRKSRQFVTHLDHLQNIDEDQALNESKAVVLEGSALKKRSVNKHLSTKQKKFLQEKFALGEGGGKNATAIETMKDMRREKDPNNPRKLRFVRDDWLTKQQIATQFSLMNRKKKAPKVPKEPKLKPKKRKKSTGCFSAMSPSKKKRLDEDEDSDFEPLYDDPEEEIEDQILEDHMAEENAQIQVENQIELISSLKETAKMDRLDEHPILVRPNLN